MATKNRKTLSVWKRRSIIRIKILENEKNLDLF